MANHSSIEHLSVRGLHGHQNVHLDLKPGLNVIHGKNGSGKTTILHILANLMEGDVRRFFHLQFTSILVRTFSGNSVRLHRRGNGPASRIRLMYEDVDEAFDRNEPRGYELQDGLASMFNCQPVYLPAFRSILEASRAPDESRVSRLVGQREAGLEEQSKQVFAREMMLFRRGAEPRRQYRSQREFESKAEATASKTALCRTWFGKFVPIVRYPSLKDVTRELRGELRRAHMTLARKDQEVLATVFDGVLRSAIEGSQHDQGFDAHRFYRLLEGQASLLQSGRASGLESYDRITRRILSALEQGRERDPMVAGVLRVYGDALEGRFRVENDAFEELERFRASVNQFLHPKSLEYAAGGALGPTPPAQVLLESGKKVKLQALSSGERHILTILFAATHMSSEEGVVFIDEPELSLHVDWQRILLGELLSQAGQRQVIACTHSPEIVADHQRYLVRLRPSPSDGEPIDPEFLD